MPAMRARVCVPFAPMRIVFWSVATPGLPISMLLFPVVTFSPASAPMVMLPLPVLTSFSVKSPSAVLCDPVVPPARRRIRWRCSNCRWCSAALPKRPWPCFHRHRCSPEARHRP